MYRKAINNFTRNSFKRVSQYWSKIRYKGNKVQNCCLDKFAIILGLIYGLVTRMTQECPKTFSGDISLGSILVRYWYTWDVPRKKIISTWQLHRRSSRHCLIGVRNVSRRSQEGLFGLFHPGSDPGTAWDAPGMHPSRNKSTHSVLSVIYWIQWRGTVWSRSWVSK